MMDCTKRNDSSRAPVRFQALQAGLRNVVHLSKKAEEGAEEAVSGGERASEEIAPSQGERGVGMRRWRDHRPHGHRRTGSDSTSDES